MNNLKLSFKLLNKNRYIKLIIIFQIFIMLMYSVRNINVIIDAIVDFNYLRESPLNNGLLFMNKKKYILDDSNIKKSNLSNLEQNYDSIRKYIQENPKDFKGFTYEKSSFFIKEYDISLKMYDAITLEILNRDFYHKINFVDKEDFIPTIVQKTFENKYKIDDIVKFKIGKENFKFIIKGYYKDNIKLPSINILTNNKFPIGELFQELNSERANFIILNNDKIFNLLKNDTNYKNMIVYFNDDFNQVNIKKFEDYIKNNDLGYYQLTKDLINEQYLLFKNLLQNYFDIILTFIGLVLITITCISFINKDLLENRFKIYLLNGASKHDIFLTTFYHYIVVFFSGIFIYILFTNMLTFEPFQSLLKRTGIDFFMIGSMFKLDTFSFLFIALVFIFISILSSSFNIRKIDLLNKERGKI